MDAHYDIVMKAREAAGQGRRRYFAYSTVLDRDAFVEWRSQHGYDFFELPKGTLGEAKDLSLVYDFPSRWWGGRVAGLSDTPGSRVCGVVFDLDEKDWPIIQHKEGAVTGMCVERAVTVKLASGETVEATAFTTNPVRKSLDGPVSQRFVEALVRGARSAGLESAWVDSLTG
jgi:gamma-glutamylcyclotransferase